MSEDRKKDLGESSSSSYSTSIIKIRIIKEEIHIVVTILIIVHKWQLSLQHK
jgi:hypothetical protein